MGGHHARHADHGGGSSSLTQLALAVIVPIAVLTLAGLVWLWPEQGIERSAEQALPELDGQVSQVQRETCPEELPDEVNGCGTATVTITGEPDDAEQRSEPVPDEVRVSLPNGPGAPLIETGDEVVLIESETPDGATYALVDQQRAGPLAIIALAFVLAVVAFGRWRGVTALLGLALTFALLLFFVVPAIVAGEPPMLVAIVGSSAIMLTVLYLTHGFSAPITVALLGTLASLTLTAVLSALTVSALHLTGVTDDLATSVVTTYGVNMEGLLLAGIVIGALGVLDDVTVTQAVTVSELARADPASGVRELYRAGSRVGRAHIASVINTIILAYAGSALPLMILIIAGGSSLGDVVTDQVIAQEIARSVVATLGLVAAVPLTTLLWAWVARRVPAGLGESSGPRGG
jgi:uncharacterized membrane protein